MKHRGEEKEASSLSFADAYRALAALEEAWEQCPEAFEEGKEGDAFPLAFWLGVARRRSRPR